MTEQFPPGVFFSREGLVEEAPLLLKTSSECVPLCTLGQDKYGLFMKSIMLRNREAMEVLRMPYLSSSRKQCRA